MKKSIVSYIIEIIFITFLVIFSYFMINNSAYAKVDKNFVEDNNIKIDIINNNIYLQPMNDEYAKNNLKDTIINITNYNSKNISYKFYMQIKKDKQINYDNLKVKVDNQIFSLSSKYSHEDNDYVYFDLIHKNINKTNNINFNMWLDENTKDYSNYTFSYNFSIERI